MGNELYLEFLIFPFQINAYFDRFPNFFLAALFMLDVYSICISRVYNI